MLNVKKSLEIEARAASRLIIWTDCDREGENIGFEIISVCRAVNPNLAKFSEITFQSVNRAIQNLGQPDEKLNNAVDVRSELDLRIGAAFTRFQTLRLQKVFPEVLSQTLISYGSCQFPTLGFVVERYKAIENFIPEQFWKIKVFHEIENCVVEFHWRRVRLFDQLVCQVLHEKLLEKYEAFVKSVKSRMKSKWRPLPLDTVELEKLASRKLRLNAKETMRLAEKLYTSGFISYPRTETNIFPKELDLRPLVQMQTVDPNWGEFAMRVVTNGPTPRQGKKSDQAHPPIHPTKYAPNLDGNEKRVYEFIVRHFLACCDKDAKGTETIVDINIADEEFTASGLIILERNYLEVYPYDKWSDKEMPNYQQNQVFQPTSIDMVDGETSPPPLLTEADLIALMEKHGIGTDATHADHIETIKSRLYVGLQETRFVPGELGMGLVEGYDSMGFQMSKPNLRSEFEADLKRICDGTKDPKLVLKEQVGKYRNVFVEALKQASKIDVALGKFLNETPQTPVDVAIPDVPQMDSSIMKCPSCGSDIIIKSKRDNKGLYASCQGYPDCRECIWFPDPVKKAEVLDEKCTVCEGAPRKIKFTFAPRSYSPLLPDEFTTCIAGCDSFFMETLDIRALRAKPKGNLSTSHDSGFSSSNNNSSNSNRGFTPASSSATRIVLTNRSNLQAPQNAPPFRNRSEPQSSIFSSQTQRNSFTPTASVHPNFNQNFKNREGTQSNVNPLQNLQPTFNRNSSFQNFRNNDNRNSTYQNNRSNDPCNGNSNNIVCNCNLDAIKLTVRKEGPNTGRQFYKCSKHQHESCNFFLWADDDEKQSLSSNRTGVDNNSGFNNFSQSNNFSQPNWNRSDFGSFPERNSFSQQSSFTPFERRENFSDEENERIVCNCGIEAKKLTTLKEGANKGREFYTCPKIREEQCGYFQWVDEISVNNRGNNIQRRGASRGRGGRGSSRGQNRGDRGGLKRKGSEGETGPKRKCGLCGEYGHDRRNCPNT
ncbi:DNA topoisomerase 3-alpha [Armadillidium nasatum]|uniref:DNA topoisomerase n=1 Tax=Armadillidium nasatum TaxID=96803 RepID=A0A5N5T3I6_9CRUS|nr:DNA topoisomerase 3-alpha [Armadillidium nasatum]